MNSVNNLIKLCLPFMILLAIACDGNDPDFECIKEQKGYMYVRLDDDSAKELNYDLVIFESDDDRTVEISANIRLDNCVALVSHFFKVRDDLTQQPLKNVEKQGDTWTIGSTQIWLKEGNTEGRFAFSEAYDLINDEPASLQINQRSDKEIKGIFQGTYVRIPGFIGELELPDTLRFNNVEFTAVLVGS